MSSNNINIFLGLLSIIIILLIILILNKCKNYENFQATSPSLTCQNIINNPVVLTPMTYSIDPTGKRIYTYDYTNFYKEIFYSMAFLFPGYFVCRPNSVFDTKDREIEKINELIQSTGLANDGSIYKNNSITIEKILNNINPETFPEMFFGYFDVKNLSLIYEYILSLIPTNPDEMYDYSKSYLMANEIYKFKQDTCENIDAYTNIQFELNADNETSNTLKIYMRTNNNKNKTHSQSVKPDTINTNRVCLISDKLCYRETRNIHEFVTQELSYKRKLEDVSIRNDLILYFKLTLVYSLYLVQAYCIASPDDVQKYLPSDLFINQLNNLYDRFKNANIIVAKHVSLTPGTEPVRVG